VYLLELQDERILAWFLFVPYFYSCTDNNK
jgi:hypothetical protein